MFIFWGLRITTILCLFCGISLAYFYCYFINHFQYCVETESSPTLFSLFFSYQAAGSYPEALSPLVLTRPIHILPLLSLFITYKSRDKGSEECNYWLWNFSRAPGLMILQLLNRKTLIIYYNTVDLIDNVLLLSSQCPLMSSWRITSLHIFVQYWFWQQTKSLDYL